MKIKITQRAAIAGMLTFALTSCDPERNKASLGGSADTVFTESAKHLDSARGQTNIDSTNSKKDSTTSSGNVDPSGRMKNQNQR